MSSGTMQEHHCTILRRTAAALVIWHTFSVTECHQIWPGISNDTAPAKNGDIHCRSCGTGGLDLFAHVRDSSEIKQARNTRGAHAALLLGPQSSFTKYLKISDM